MKFLSNYGQPDTGGMTGKLAKVKEQLQKLNRKKAAGDRVGNGQAAGGETIADDTAQLANKAEMIRRDEAVVRGALALVGVDYDGLIKMGGEGKDRSVYAQAVQANPTIMDQVAKAEVPVLAALKIAVGYKPFAEFAGKYGETPEAIKAAIKAEVESDAKANGQDTGMVKKPLGPVFSSSGGQRVAAKPRKTGSLTELFGK